MKKTNKTATTLQGLKTTGSKMYKILNKLDPAFMGYMF